MNILQGGGISRKPIQTRMGLILTGIVACLASLTGLAWACTVQPRILTLAPPAGEPGSIAILRGEGLAPQGEIEVRWDGLQGPVIGKGQVRPDLTFEVTLTVPNQTSGIHYVVAAVKSAGVARAPFQILTGDETHLTLKGFGISASQDLWKGFEEKPEVIAEAARTAVGRDNPALFAGALFLMTGLTAAAAAAVVGTRRTRHGT